MEIRPSLTENFIGTVPLLGMSILLVACWFYMWGGRSGKWKQRFIGSFLCFAGLSLEFLLLGILRWELIFVYPLTVMAFVLGYGSDSTLLKIWKRTYIVAASVLSSILICALYKSGWSVLPIELIVASVTVYLGVKNPAPAAAEEFYICLFLWSPKLIYPLAVWQTMLK